MNSPLRADQMMEEIRKRAAERRSEHPEIEEEIAKLRNMTLGLGTGTALGELEANLYGANLAHDPTLIPQDTRYQFAKRLILRVARVFMRGQVEYNAFVARTLNALRRWMADSAHENERRKKEIHELGARLSLIEREQAETVDLVRRFGDIKNQKEAERFPVYENHWLKVLAARHAGAGVLPNRLAFAEEFLGSEAELKAQWRPYVDLFRHHEPTVVLECGRGEFLELLRDAGIQTRGVEGNPALARYSASRGLPAIESGPLEFLRQQPDRSIGGVFAARVLERLDWPALLSFVGLLCDKVAVGGIVLLEGFNPACLRVHTHGVYLDPTHVRPYDPAGIAFVCRNIGFLETEVRYHNPARDGQRAAEDAIHQKYAVIARR